MPTYHARDITVRLGSVLLTETITNDIVLRKGEKAKQQSELAERKLLHSPYLHEKRLLFPDAADDFELNWLGNAPFMQVEASNGTALPSGLTGGAPQDRAAQALVLHVELSDKAFHAGFTAKTHLKIEVLFNGQLSACSLTHTNDIRSGAKALHQVFAGYRIDFLAERPWVLLPSFMTADGGTRRFHKTITPLERFDEISAALLGEAERRGTDKHGAAPPSADFIRALAKTQAPASVMDLQKPGGKKFGVIDVIITAGTGNKLTTGMNYLKRPQRLKDSNYAVRTEIENELENKTNTAAAEMDESRSASGGVSQKQKSRPDSTYIDMEESSEVLDERPYKRQALSMAEVQSHRGAPNTDSPAPVLSTQAPFLPPQNGTMLQAHVSPTAGRVTSHCSSPKRRTDGHIDPLTCSSRNHTCRTAGELPQMQGYTSTSSRDFQHYRSPPAIRHLSTPQPVPMFSELAGTSHRTLNISQFPDSALGTAQDHNEGSLSFPQPLWCGGNELWTPVGPYVSSAGWMLPTVASWPSSPIAMTSPHSRPTCISERVQSNTYPPSPAPSGPPNGLPSLGPQMPFFYDHPDCSPLATPILSSPPVLQMGGPLPPTAMFSVPSKPRRSAPPSKGVAAAESAQPNSGVLVRRLKITGLNGRPVVDHRWKNDQHVAGNRCACPQDPASAPSTEHDGPIDKLYAQQQSHSPITSVQSKTRACSPVKDVGSEATKQSMHEERRDSLQDGQAGLLTKVPLPYLRRHQCPLNEFPVVNPQIDVPECIAPFVPASMLTTVPNTQLSRPMQTTSSGIPTAPVSSPRRTLQRYALPSIQGPKATTFLYDDPEEVLREAGRAKRSKSPKKPPANAHASLTASPAQPNATADQNGPGDSSPLSSAPSSPLPEVNAGAVGTVPLPPNEISQLDGFSEASLPTISRSPQNPIVSTPKLQRPAPTTPQSSVSPDSKKRKLVNRWPVKVPRSPDRLKTVSNPPLNDDCVIAFAESTDKSEKTGVLRQVRGERQGVFKEDYVVLAVRFYIAGG